MSSPLVILDLGGATPTSHLAVDLLQVNYKGKFENSFEAQEFVPRIAYKCEENGSLRLQLPAQVYRVESLNAYILTIRSGIPEGKIDQLSKKIAEWTKQLGAEDVITLSSEIDYSAQFVDPYSGISGLALVSSDASLQMQLAEQCGIISISGNLQTPPQEFLGGVAEKLYERLKVKRLISLISFAFNPAANVYSGLDLFKKVLYIRSVLRGKGELGEIETKLDKMSLEEGDEEVKTPKNWKLLGLHK